MPPVGTRSRVGVVKLTSCDGCPLTLLDLEDELLAIAERFDIVDFPEATSVRSDGPYDVLFVEGSISAPERCSSTKNWSGRTSLFSLAGASIGQRSIRTTAFCRRATSTSFPGRSASCCVPWEPMMHSSSRSIWPARRGTLHSKSSTSLARIPATWHLRSAIRISAPSVRSVSMCRCVPVPVASARS